MTESIMAQEMKTWLRDECIKEPLRYFTLLYRLADGADLYLIEGKDVEAIEHIKTAKRAVDVVNSQKLPRCFSRTRTLHEQHCY